MEISENNLPATWALLPSGQWRATIRGVQVPPTEVWHLNANWQASSILGREGVDFAMTDPATGAVQSKRIMMEHALVDGQEPNTPNEYLDLRRTNPTFANGLPVEDRIPTLPVNERGCSTISESCVGLDRTYIDTLGSGHISSAGDIDWFQIPRVRAGTRLTADLSNLPADADLVLYGPAGTASTPSLFPARSGAALTLADDPGLGIGQDAQSLAVTDLTSLHLDQGYDDPILGIHVPARTPLSISQHRGTDNEAVGAIAPVDGDYIVQVSGHNTESSVNPYTIRVRGFTPEDPTQCTPRTLTLVAPTATAEALDPGTNTVFLTNPSRLAATYGQTAATEVAAKLADTVGYLRMNLQKGLTPAVVPVDIYPAVREAYAAWDANPCSVPAANAVTAALTGVLEEVRSAGNDLKYVTLVGGDDILPMGRVPDLARVANESGYADNFLGADNPLSASTAGGYTLSDDPYGDTSPTSLTNGGSLFIPRVAVGRLVETPAEIGAALAAYIAKEGTLDTSTGLVSGYDFLSDGATATADRLAVGGRNVDRLIDPPGTTPGWSGQNLLDRLFPTGHASPLVASLNAHYDHQALLSSAGDLTDGNDLVTQDEVSGPAGTDKLAGRVFFTMGCHAGLSVPDAYVTGTAADGAAQDWAQTLAAANVAVYVANTGFGIGDSASVAYSERLMALFAKLLDGSMTVGQALTWAKQSYYGSLGAVGVYDSKILQQTAFYGLPFWEVDTGHPAPAAPTRPALPGVMTPDVATGLQAVEVELNPDLAPVSAAGRTHWTVRGQDPQVTQFQPIQPRLSVPVGDSGLVAHGALIGTLESHDVAGVTPNVSTPVVDTSAAAPPVRSDDAAWPTSIASITTSQAPYGRDQHLVVTPGQFTGSTFDGTGVQRLFDHVGASVLYSPESTADFTPPAVGVATGEPNGTEVSFSVAASDAESGTVNLVRVGYQDPDGSWKFTDLTRSAPDASTWIGTGDLSTTASAVHFFVQAVDDAGNVGVASGKVAGYVATGDKTAPTITATVSPAPNAAGWVKGAKATVTFTCSDAGSGIAEGACPAPIEVVTSGSTTQSGHVRDKAGNEASVTIGVNLDGSAPVLAASSTVSMSGWSAATSATVSFTCSDEGGSGLAGSCPEPVVVAAEGTTTVERTLTDVAGNSTSTSTSVRLDRTAPTVTITGTAPELRCVTTDSVSGVATEATGVLNTDGVLPTAYTCSGARDNAGNLTPPVTQPILLNIGFSWLGKSLTTPPATTTASRGSSVQVNFKLTVGSTTLSTLGAVKAIDYRTVDCKGWTSQNPWTTAQPAPGTALSYAPLTTSYNLVWKTPKVTGCYELRITLADNLENFARIKLT